MSKDFPGIIYSSTLSSFIIFVRLVLAGKRILRVAVGVVLRLLGVDVVELKWKLAKGLGDEIDERLRERKGRYGEGRGTRKQNTYPLGLDDAVDEGSREASAGCVMSWMGQG